MDKNYLTLNEAALRLNKSVQTVRRMVKKGELVSERVRTPQGFNYLIDEESLRMFYNSPIQNVDSPHVPEEKTVLINQKKIPTNQTPEPPHTAKDYYVLDIQEDENVVNSQKEIERLYRLVEQYHLEKMFLLHLIEKWQDRT